MSENKPEKGENTEYQFMREKIIPKRRSKWKRFFMMLGGTLLFACVFGITARYFFIASEPVLNQILGITPTPTPTIIEKQPISLPSELPTEDPLATKGATPTSKPQTSVTPTPIEEAVVTPSVTPIVIETTIDATLNDYINMHQEIRKLASSVDSSLATVTTIVSGINWFEESYENTSSTTGIILGDNNVDLLILVPLDQIEGATRIEVAVGGYSTSDTRIISYDQDYNLAVIGIDYDSIPAINQLQITKANFGESHYLTVGTPVLAIGNPNGYMGSYEIGTITSKGIYTYIVDDRLELFNTSIPDNENGDGIIVNMSGEIIGIITHTMKEELNESINTVVGISKIKSIIEKLANTDDIMYFGVIAEDMPELALEEAGAINGIYISEVLEGSPAEEAGIRKGDIITKLGETTIVSVSGLHNEIMKHEAGAEVTVYLRRISQQVYKEIEYVVTIQGKNDTEIEED